MSFEKKVARLYITIKMIALVVSDMQKRSEREREADSKWCKIDEGECKIKVSNT